MELESLEQNWNALGEEDPLWAILSDPEKRGGSWNVTDFLATGVAEVDDVFAEMRARRIETGRQRALDFGCGVGRLTQALSGRFARCDGIDLAASMIDGANRLDATNGRCVFHHSPAADLGIFPDGSFDFILSLLVFQHMEPGLMRSYIPEFLRVLTDGGAAYFNIPETFITGVELPSDSFRARFTASPRASTLARREVMTVKVTVKNDSGVTWPAAARINLGNHWLSADHRVVVGDDARCGIEAELLPGASHELELPVVAPDSPGDYLLELDLVQEQKGWFADRGSPTLRLPIVVSESVAAPVHRDSDDIALLAPQIEMHVMDRRETVTVVEAAGGVVLDIIPKPRCGPDVPSLDYVIARAPDRTAGNSTTGAGDSLRSGSTPGWPALRTRLVTQGRRGLLSAVARTRQLSGDARRRAVPEAEASPAVDPLQVQIDALRAEAESQKVRLATALQRIDALEQAANRRRT